MLAGHNEQLSHHPTTLTDILLHKFAATDANKLAVRMMCNGTRKESLSCTGRPIEQDTFGLGDSKCFEQFGMLDREFDDFLDLLDLLVEASDHFVRAIGNLFDHHKRDKGVDLVGEDLVEGIRIRTEGDAERRFELGNVNGRVDIDNYVVSDTFCNAKVIKRTIFAFWLDLDEYLGLAHDFHDFSDITSGLV